MDIRQTPAALRRKMRGDRMLFSSSEDNVLMKKIEDTHSPGGREIDARALLHIVEDIFNHATPSFDAVSAQSNQVNREAMEDKTYQASFAAMVESCAPIIDRVASEIACKCTGNEDAHATTISILKMLSEWSCSDKLVIALAAFALNYGEFWLVAQSYNSNQLAKSVAILRKLPDIFEHSSLPRFDAVRSLIKVMLDVTKRIIEFRQLSSQYITADHLTAFSTAMAHVSIAVYWTIRGILACSSQMTGLIGLAHEQTATTTEAWELSSLTHKLSNMQSHLAAQLETCHKHIDGNKQMEAYQSLSHLFEMNHIDNTKILKALINEKDDLQPLLDGATKKRVNVDVLRRKYVLLLVSDMNVSQEELAILEQLYSESRQHPAIQDSQYEVVWLPIVDQSIPWTESRQKQFEYLQTSMLWYTVHHPPLIEKAVIKFIKEAWLFDKKPILVVLDPQGNVACPNALHMMWIWGSAAFPFTTAREEALWKEESWRLELLVNGIDPSILTWISEGRHIFLYGGEDMEWIRKFTSAAQSVARAAGILFGIVYVGKSNPKERVQQNISTIIAENLSHCWQDLNSIWYFWIRMKSMWHSKNQLGRTIENDPIMRDITALLTFDATEGGWVILSRGSAEITKAKGNAFLKCLTEYDSWKELAQQKGFVTAIRDHLMELHTPDHCNRFVLPGTTGRIPERVNCSECGRTMERFIMYQCCDE